MPTDAATAEIFMDGSAEMIRLASWMRRVWSQVWNVIPRVWLK